MDKLTEITTQKVDGKMAPDFDTFIWGWGGDPYDPSIAAQPDHDGRRSAARRTRSTRTPSTTSCTTQQAGEFDPAKRKEIVKQMIAITQRDLPYLVLTVDPILQAYRTDRLGGVERVCPKPTGDVICEQVGYAPWLTLGPPVAADGAERPATAARARR